VGDQLFWDQLAKATGSKVGDDSHQAGIGRTCHNIVSTLVQRII